MAVWSIIKKSELEGSSYIASEFYHPDKLKSQKLVHKIGKTQIRDEFKNVKNLYNPSSTRNLVKEKLKIFDLADAIGNLLKNGLETSSIEDIGSTKKIVKKNDIIISRLRSYLKEFALVHYNDFFHKLVSTEFIVLRRKKDTKYTPQFLLIYLLTDTIQDILRWSQTGTQHPRFDEDVLFNLLLPDFSVLINDITEKVNESIILFEDSKLLYSQAEQILLEELGLKDLDLKDDLFYKTTLKRVKDNNRMDPGYYMPKYNKLMEHIIDISEPIKSYIKNYSTGYPFKSDNFVSDGFPLIRITNIGKGYLDISNTAFIAEKDVCAASKDIAMPGDVVISMSGSIGVSAKIPEEFKKCYINQRILRINTKNIDNDYLCLLLNSIVGSYQFNRIGTGGVQTNISYRDMKEIYIPRIKIENKIGQMIRDSLNKRESAKALLEEAKHKVEKMIEKEAGEK